MREIRPSGSEGGGTQTNESSLPLSSAALRADETVSAFNDEAAHLTLSVRRTDQHASFGGCRPREQLPLSHHRHDCQACRRDLDQGKTK